MLNSRRKILVYTHAMTGGGAERVCAVLASGFARRGHEVILAVDFAATENLHLIDPAVRIAVLSASHSVAVIKLAILLFREKPDVAMSGLCISNLKLFIASLLSGRLPRMMPSYHGYSHSEPQLLSRISYALTPLMTRLTGATVAVSEGLRRSIISRWGASRAKTLTIYNPVDTGRLRGAASEAELLNRAPVVLAAGRLVSYKNFPLLVRAFGRLDHPDARLVIIGQGPERAAIQAEIDRLHLGARVTLAGYAEEPWRYYEQARCFALSSDSESFGLVVVEALAAGLPVVSTNCHGPSEIINDDTYGRLTPVGDEAALAEALEQALSHPGEPAPRLKRAVEFSLDRGLDAYLALFERIISHNDRTSARTRAASETGASA